jgi:hypothetical protein
MVMSQDQNAGRSYNIKTDNSSFERVEEFKFLGTTLTNQNSIHEDNHSTLQSGNACCHLVKNLKSFNLLSKIIKIKVQKTVILSIILYGYENWSLTLKEVHVLRVFQNKVLRKIFGPKRDEVTVERRKLHNEELNDIYASPNILKDEMDEACSMYV